MSENNQESLQENFSNAVVPGSWFRHVSSCFDINRQISFIDAIRLSIEAVNNDLLNAGVTDNPALFTAKETYGKSVRIDRGTNESSHMLESMEIRRDDLTEQALITIVPDRTGSWNIMAHKLPGKSMGSAGGWAINAITNEEAIAAIEQAMHTYLKYGEHRGLDTYLVKNNFKKPTYHI